MKSLLYVYGNCQANPIRSGLALQPDFVRLFESRKLPSFKSFDEDIKPQYKPAVMSFRENASMVRVFIYQEELWDKNSAEILSLLPDSCIRIPIHSIATSALWPNYIKDWEVRKFLGKHDGDIVDWSGDSFIMRAAKNGLPAEEIVRQYLAMDMNAEFNLHRWLANDLAGMRRKEKVSVLRVADVVEERFKADRQFYAANHPSNKLLRKATDDILEALNLAPLESSVGDAWASTDVFAKLIHHPVHPKIIEHYGLAYLTAETRYLQASEWFKFETWVRRYAEIASTLYGRQPAEQARASS